jgi:peptidoglycan/xylan/chitin deacetylase (PgdA/CDA1 family)
MVLFLSSDVEQDAPPYMNSERGIVEGLPRLLELLDELKVRATFFVVGRVAERHPRAVYNIVERGHELGSHGYAHIRLDRIPLREAEDDVRRSLRVLRDFGEVRSFRAPNLKLPRQLLPVLREEGISVDASLASYKPPFPRGITVEDGVVRVPATVTSSVLRVPWALQRPLLALMPRVTTLFVHPWEVSGLVHWRPDIWIGTGPRLLGLLRNAVSYMVRRGYRPMTMSEAPSLLDNINFRGLAQPGGR